MLSPNPNRNRTPNPNQFALGALGCAKFEGRVSLIGQQSGLLSSLITITNMIMIKSTILNRAKAFSCPGFRKSEIIMNFRLTQ